MSSNNIDHSDHSYCYSSKLKKLNFVSLNVCGLRAKLKFPDFQEFINKYDIVCLTEIKTDQYDEIDIDGFKFISASRAIAKRKSGGVGLFIKAICKDFRQFK